VPFGAIFMKKENNCYGESFGLGLLLRSILLAFLDRKDTMKEKGKKGKKDR
jgi:hypothetical protein